MSKWIQCETCGEQVEAPAYSGDGVYSVHVCNLHRAENASREKLAQVGWTEGDDFFE
jgi:hypothetical protein